MKLDQIYIISLHNSKNRQSKMKKWIPENDKLVTWWLVKRDNEDPKRGVFTSHSDILKDAKMKGFNYILVLEDDTVPNFPLDYIFQQIENFLQNQPKKWKFLMLGYFPFRTRKTNRPNITSIKCAAGAHAYIVNVNKVKVPKWKGIQIDDLYFCKGSVENLKYINNKISGVLGHKPVLINQNSEKSLINDFHTVPQKFIETFGNESMVETSENINLINLSVFIIFLFLLFIIFIPFLIAFNYESVGVNVLYLFLALFILLILIFTVVFSVDAYQYRGCEYID